MTRAIPGQPPATKRPSNPAEDVRAVDLELAQRCRHGDAAAFEELYRAHAGRLYNLVFRMVGSAQEAEDLLQDVFLNAYRKLGSFRGDSSLGTWLYRLAVNQCLDVLRAAQREPVALQALAAELRAGLGRDRQLDQAITRALGWCERIDSEAAARRALEEIILAWQGVLLTTAAPAAVAESFCAGRLADATGWHYGTLPVNLPFAELIARGMPHL